jgi:hypothetical protein
LLWLQLVAEFAAVWGESFYFSEVAEVLEHSCIVENLAWFIEHYHFGVILVDVNHQNCGSIIDLLDVVYAEIPPPSLLFWPIISIVSFLYILSIELFVVHKQSMIVCVISLVRNKHVELYLVRVSRRLKFKPG